MSKRSVIIVFWLAAACGWARSGIGEPLKPVALAYGSGSQAALSGRVKGLRATVNFAAVPPQHRPPELPEQEILNIPGFNRVRAPGPAVRTPLGAASVVRPRTALANPPASAPDDFVTFLSSPLSNLGAFYSSTAPEPSVASHDRIVFVTGNWYAALSTDSGQSFQYVDPFSTFPSANGGFCCDQVTLHEPTRDLLVWGLQYIQDASGDTFRLAVAVGPANQASGSFFYYDFTAQEFGYPAGDILDFPALAYGANSLYFSSNVFGSGGYAGTVVARMSLDELAAAGTLNFSYLSQSVAGYKIAQGIGATAYFATHTATNNVRILRWTEGDGTLYWDDVPVTAFQDGGGSCTDPGGTNWCGYADIRVGAAWRTDYGGGQIGVMWNAAQGGPFALAYPYVQVAILRESDRALLAESEIWNPGYAYQYPSAGINGRGDLAGTIAYGGGSLYVSSAVWIDDDVNSHTLAPLENYVLGQGVASNGVARWGDFFTTSAQSVFTNSWVTVGAAPDTLGASNESFFWLGRRRDLPPAPNNDFYTLTPCRLIDTRGPSGTFGAPALAGSGAQRSFPVANQCGIPIDAAAIAVNVTIAQPSAAGDLRLYPSGIGMPLVSVINFAPGETRANNAVLSLSGSPLGSFTVSTDMAPGSVHLIVDVTGFFR